MANLHISRRALRALKLQMLGGWVSAVCACSVVVFIASVGMFLMGDSEAGIMAIIMFALGAPGSCYAAVRYWQALFDTDLVGDVTSIRGSYRVVTRGSGKNSSTHHYIDHIEVGYLGAMLAQLREGLEYNIEIFTADMPGWPRRKFVFNILDEQLNPVHTFEEVAAQGGEHSFSGQPGQAMFISGTVFMYFVAQEEGLNLFAFNVSSILISLAVILSLWLTLKIIRYYGYQLWFTWPTVVTGTITSKRPIRAQASGFGFSTSTLWEVTIDGRKHLLPSILEPHFRTGRQITYCRTNQAYSPIRAVYNKRQNKVHGREPEDGIGILSFAAGLMLIILATIGVIPIPIAVLGIMILIGIGIARMPIKNSPDRYAKKLLRHFPSAKFEAHLFA